MENLNKQELEKYQALLNDALIYKSKGQYDESLNKFIEIFQSGVIQTDILYQLADTYFMMDDFKRTIVWGKKIIELDEEFLQAYWLTALAYYKLDDVKHSLIMLEAGLERGSIGEYEPIFAGILDADLVKKYRNFILIKCPKVKAELIDKDWQKKSKKSSSVEAEDISISIDNNKDIELTNLISAIKSMNSDDNHLSAIIERAKSNGFLNKEDIVDLQQISKISIVRNIRAYENIFERQQILNILATGFFAVEDYKLALELLIEADKLGNDAQTIKNIAAILSQIGELELAINYLKKIGGKDIMALNLLGQINLNAQQ